jgi:hypothetical protein
MSHLEIPIAAAAKFRKQVRAKMLIGFPSK